MSGLNPKEVAYFIVTQANWSTKYRLKEHPRYKSLFLGAMETDFDNLYRALKDLLPSLEMGAVEVTPREKRIVFYADPEEIRLVRANSPKGYVR